MPENKPSKTAELIIDGKKHLLPILEGLEGDKAIDIRGLLRNTGYTVYDYKTITRIAVSAATTAAITVGTNQIASSMPIMLDNWAPAPTSIQVTVAGTVNYTVQQTLDDLNRITGGYVNATWVNHPDSALVAVAATAQGNYAYVPQFIRVTLNTETAGAGNSITMTVIQADA